MENRKGLLAPASMTEGKGLGVLYNPSERGEKTRQCRSDNKKGLMFTEKMNCPAGKQ